MRVWVLPIVLLVVGLLAGFGGGAVLRPVTMTETLTTTQPVTTTLTQTSTIRETMTETTTSISTQTITTTSTTTSSTTYWITNTITQTTTTTRTAYTTVYPAESGDILVTDRGSGNKDTSPFTLDAPSDLKITIRITARANLRYVGLSWYLYNVDLERWIKNGGVNEEQGVFEFYAARIPAGNWYVRILSANCNWEITVEKVT
jgi:cytoskeletal protein RodZ